MASELSSPWAAICARVGELTNICAIHVHHEDLVLATGTWPEGHEKDLVPVGRPRWSPAAPTGRRIGRIFWREIDLFVSVGDHPKHRTVSFAKAHERDVPPVGRPDRHLGKTGWDFTRQLDRGPASIRTDRKDINAPPEHNLLAVWRPTRVSAKCGRIGELCRCARSVRVHDVDLKYAAIAVTIENDLLSVRRPSCPLVG